ADNCTAAPTVTFISETSDNGFCPETITRVYRITDDCGNFIEVDHLIQISDAISPTASNPAALNVQCVGDVPAPNPAVVIDEADNSGVPPVVTFVSGVSNGNSCPETITRTYSVTDDCGNTINVTQLIIINDTQAPVFAAAPANVTVECTGDVPPSTNLGWTDNCDGAGNVLGVDSPIVGGTCGGTITRTWTYTDACGNVSSTTQTITINDTQNPVFAAAPANVTVECTGDVPAMTNLGWTDNCDGAGSVPGADGPIVGGNCGGTITRTWTHTDACGNVGTTTQTITINDTQNPVFAAAPSNVTVECSGDVPPMTNLAWTDNCDVSGSVAGVDGLLVGGTCGGTITRTWAYTDACGNIGTTTQTITINDTQAPTFAAAPADISVQCIGDVPAMTNLTWTDNCDGTGSVVGADGGLIGGACGGTITRTWTYTDGCGNTATSTQIITVDDTTLPTASNPATTSVLQGNPIPPVDVTVVIDEADNCTAVPVVAFVSEVSDGNSCPETITRTYSVTDDCGNFIEVAHLIIIDDNIAPTASNPPGLSVSCFVNVPAPDPTVVTDEADNSVIPPVVAFVSDVSDGNSCPETITRTYSITDDCGNSINVTQQITIIPTAAPVIPADVTTTVECIAGAVQPIPPAVTDECGNSIVPAVVIGADPACEGNKVFTFTYTDCAGNNSVYTYTYVLDVVTAPAVPANGSEAVVCVEDIYIPTPPVVTDVCGNNIVPVMTQTPDPVCVGDKVFTFTYTDCAGNASVYTYTFSINDNVPPSASNPAAISVPGSMDVPAPDPLVVIDEADNCIGAVTVDWVDDVSDGNVCNGEIITRTYSVTDACGNQILVTQEITILAVYPPIDAGQDTIVCIGDWATVNAINPWGMPFWWDNGVVDGTPWQPAATLLYTVTADNLGCISTDDMWVTMEEPPVVSFTADLMGGCAPMEINFVSTSTTTSAFDNCEWTVNGTPITGDCSGATFTFDAGGLYDIGLTTTSVNGCTNSALYDDFIFMEDVPEAAFDVSSSSVQSIDTEVDFYNNSIGASTYVWNFGDGSSSTNENPTHSFPEDPSGSYNVQLFAYSQDYGCVDSANLTIAVEEVLIFYVPNSFTPDGDTYNQTFQPVFHSGYDPFDFELLIFNRWGEIIFESHDASVGWDGSYGLGRTGLVQDGTYTWKIEFKMKYTDERKVVHGSVNLIR
ncbi:MAG: gliding motility-associated C-terminal domain-containing protein, partial [Crocinitomicaceae bacterium]|nr:gliding motility-associated C-terminal domain-containing protein [Crocinitomicaceae bacterium]